VTDCDDVDLILAVGAVSGGLPSDELQTMQEHLAGCQRCRRAAAEYGATADLMAIAVDQVQPSEMLRTRIMAQVYASTSAQTRAESGPGAVGTLRGLLGRAWRAVPAGRGLTLGGAAAALAAVGLLVWTVGPGRGGGTAAPLSSVVKGPVGGPVVQGSVTYYPQTQTTVLSVHGLAPRATQVYEVWLVRPSNAVTAAGYLTEQPDGTWSVALHGSIGDYSAVAATVEPAGGSSTPTGPQVLVGTLPST
jgi:anti-sigma-K factor RskA